MSFEMTTLGEYIKVQGGYAYKSKDFIESSNNKVLKIKNVRFGTIDYSEPAYVSNEIAEATKNWKVKEGDILISMTGSGPNAPQSLVGRVARVWKNEPDAWINQRVGRVCLLDEAPVHLDFIFYWLSLPQSQDYLVSNSSGSANQANISGKIIESLPCPKVDYQTSKQIADLARKFDEKIILNSQTNQTLEEMAQAIFKSWFVDFDPVKAMMNGEQPEGMDAVTASLFPEKLVESELGLIPEGWEVSQLSDICKNHSQSYNLKSADEVVFVNTGDVQEGDFLHKNYSPVVGLPGQAKKAIKEDDILYSEIRPKNKRFAYVDFDVSDYVVSTKFMVIQANEKVHPRLLYMILTRQNTIDEFNIIADSRSGTFPQITFKAISNLEFCMAPREIQDAFVSQIMPMIKLQSSLKSENKQLAEMRDTLLPKLLSGEIELGRE